jgi:hypothetical protein
MKYDDVKDGKWTSRRTAPRGSAFLRRVFLRSPSSGKRMRIQDVTGAETLLDHLQIICGNKSERYMFKVYISEMPNKADKVKEGA